MQNVWCDYCTWTVYDLWRLELCLNSERYSCVNRHATYKSLFQFPLAPISVHCNFCCWNCPCFCDMEIGLCTTCSATWEHDHGPICGPCEFFPYSLRFEFFVIRWLCSWSILLWTWRIQSFRFHLTPNHLHRVGHSLNRSEWLVWWILQGIAEATLSPFVFWHCSGFFFIIRVVRNRANASLFFRSVQFLFFFPPAQLWLLAESFLTCFTILPAKYVMFLWCFVSLTNLPWINIYPSGAFLLSSANRVTPIQGSDTDLYPSIFQQSLMPAVRSTSMLVFVSLDINEIQRYGKIVLRNIQFRPWSNMIPICVIFHNSPEILSSFNISGCFFFLSRFFTQWWRGCQSSSFSSVLHGNTHSLSLFLSVCLFWIESFFEWI